MDPKLTQLASLGFDYQSLTSLNEVLQAAYHSAAYMDAFSAPMPVQVEQQSPSTQTLSNFEHNDWTEEKSITKNKRQKWFPASRTTQKNDPQLAQLSQSYFWERRTVLLQLLNSYESLETVLIRATPKPSKRLSKIRSRGSQYRGVSKNKSKW